ncbi:hypothetical protein BKG69_06095 [Mycobacteroides chelonae]|nr:hypothetical protein BKG69_06095 [Mycobacteroides chelonae]
MSTIYTHSAVVDFEFQCIADNFAAKVKCQHHGGCRREAQWIITFHSCGQKLLCTQHKNRFLGIVEGRLAAGKLVICAVCRKPVHSVGELFTARRLDCRVGG